MKDILLHTAAALALFAILTGIASASTPFAIAVAVSAGIYIREVTQIQKTRDLPFLRGWLLGGSTQKHLEWGVPALVTLAAAAAVTL